MRSLNGGHCNNLQYLGHVWGQLRAYEAGVAVVDGGVDARYHHRPWRRLTGDAWVMAHVAVVACSPHITGPRDITSVNKCK